MTDKKIYFGFAIADSMFPAECTLMKKTISVDDVRSLADQGILIPCLNPSHGATINAMKSKYDINVTIPEVPPRVSLDSGDEVIVMSVRGLPRLTDRHEYTEEEVAAASFTFSVYTVTI